jgi:hypothetical protein
MIFAIQAWTLHHNLLATHMPVICCSLPSLSSTSPCFDTAVEPGSSQYKKKTTIVGPMLAPLDCQIPVRPELIISEPSSIMLNLY